MTREEAIAEVNKLGLTGQAREQKINELIGKKASDFKGGTWIDEAMAGRDGEAEKKIEELEEKKRMETPIDGSKGNIARGNQGDNHINNPYKMNTAEIDGKHKEELANAQNQLGTTNVGSYTTDNTFKIGSNYGKGFIGADKTTGKSETASSSNSTSSNGISNSDKNFLNNVTGISDYQKEQEMEKARKSEMEGWDDINNTIEQSRKTFKNIEDNYINQIPTFAARRYFNGDFGDISDTSTPEGRESKKNAQLRLAHFMINGLSSKLKVASNLAMINAGKTPMFSDTTSDYEKLQNSNLEQGLQNRWNKYKKETDAAAELARKQGIEAQDVKNALNKISANANMQSAFNMMNEEQKVYAIKVISEIGDKIKDFNRDDVTNFLTGALVSDKNFNSQDLLAAMGIKLGTDVLDSDTAQNIIGKIKKYYGNN